MEWKFPLQRVTSKYQVADRIKRLRSNVVFWDSLPGQTAAWDDYEKQKVNPAT